MYSQKLWVLVASCYRRFRIWVAFCEQSDRLLAGNWCTWHQEKTFLQHSRSILQSFWCALSSSIPQASQRHSDSIPTAFRKHFASILGSLLTAFGRQSAGVCLAFRKHSYRHTCLQLENLLYCVTASLNLVTHTPRNHEEKLANMHSSVFGAFECIRRRIYDSS